LVGSPVGGSASKAEARKELNELEYSNRWILPRYYGKSPLPRVFTLVPTPSTADHGASQPLRSWTAPQKAQTDRDHVMAVITSLAPPPGLKPVEKPLVPIPELQESPLIEEELPTDLGP
jgi:hypothetical protein